MALTRFSVATLHTMTSTLAAVARGREAPDLVITGARLLSPYTAEGALLNGTTTIFCDSHEIGAGNHQAQARLEGGGLFAALHGP